MNIIIRLIKILAVLLAIMGLTAACGSSGQPPRGETAPSRAEAAEPAAQAAKSSGAVTINFDYQRMKQRASDQLAVWIEDGQGNHVKTLLVTKFTATGGYEKRPAAVLNWQKSFRPAAAPKETMDAVSVATPQSGTLSYTWDCRNQAGEVVPAGSYVYKVEANIEWEKIAFWQGTITIGQSAGQSTAVSVGSESPLLRNVRAEYKPTL